MKDNLIIEKFGERKICIKGLGKLFYEQGFPISLAVFELKKNGIEVSLLHIADECLKNGWSPETTFRKLKEEFDDDIDGNIYDLELLKSFCFPEYKNQREMIFKFLFGGDEKLQLQKFNEILHPLPSFR